MAVHERSVLNVVTLKTRAGACGRSRHGTNQRIKEEKKAADGPFRQPAPKGFDPSLRLTPEAFCSTEATGEKKKKMESRVVAERRGMLLSGFCCLVWQKRVVM